MSLNVTGGYKQSRIWRDRSLGSKEAASSPSLSLRLWKLHLTATTPYELDQPIILVKVIEESYMSASGVSYWSSDRVHQIGTQVRNNTSLPPLQHSAYTARYDFYHVDVT